MKTVIYERPVYYYETDRMDCVHHSNYIRWFEESRVYLMETWGFPFYKMEEGGVVSPVLEAHAQYRSMARFGETVLVEVGVARYTGTRIAFAYTVRDKATGKVRCVGETAHCFLNAAGRPVNLRKALPDYDAACRRALEAAEAQA